MPSQLRKITIRNFFDEALPRLWREDGRQAWLQPVPACPAGKTDCSIDSIVLTLKGRTLVNSVEGSKDFYP